ncbi:hypothetical protein BGX26_001781 [Mortierella sp. AD094]|nr:hypothetical protein BGX26_001781 [Mortierella sp. AD094]
MAESESFHARRPTQHESTTVPMAETHSDVEYPNPSQHQPSQPQSHYNIAIPAIEHWLGLLVRVLKISTVYVVLTARRIHEGVRDVSAPSGKYQNVPTSANGSSSFQGNSFGGRRHSRNSGGATTCFSRRIGRILFFLLIVTLVTTWLTIPKTLKPFHNRDIWIRYFNHEEAMKVVMPYSRVVHVYDVKKATLKEFDLGYGISHAMANVKLISRYGWLRSDEEWDNDGWKFESTSYMPILAVAPNRELLQFLNDTLGCFSGREVFNRKMDIKFAPVGNDYMKLASILYKMNNPNNLFSNDEITYLRMGFKG